MRIRLDRRNAEPVRVFGERPRQEEPDLTLPAGGKLARDGARVRSDAGALAEERAGIDRDAHGGNGISCRRIGSLTVPGVPDRIARFMKRPNHIDLSSVTEEPGPVAFDIPFSLEVLDREPLLEISPVRLGGAISRIEGGFALDARCAFEGKLECSRCLAAYPFASDEPFTLLLYKRAPGSPDGRELTRDDLDVAFYEGEVVDVAPLAEERVQMSIPMKPLCREDCRGLCSRCGADRNLGSCGCGSEDPDPRWAALAGVSSAPKSQKE
jgi:uncharacterized protein